MVLVALVVRQREVRQVICAALDHWNHMIERRLFRRGDLLSAAIARVLASAPE